MASLAICLFFEKIRQRTHYLDCIVAKKFGQVLLTSFEDYREIVAHDNVRAHAACLNHQPPKRGIELGSAARNVQCRNAKPLNRIDNSLSSFSRHDFCSLRTCVDVAMLAGLITELADIDLKRINRGC